MWPKKRETQPQQAQNICLNLVPKVTNQKKSKSSKENTNFNIVPKTFVKFLYDFLKED